VVSRVNSGAEGGLTVGELDELHHPELEQEKGVDDIHATDGQAPVRPIYKALAHHKLHISCVHFIQMPQIDWQSKQKLAAALKVSWEFIIAH